jgi:hypothetical protein
LTVIDSMHEHIPPHVMRGANDLMLAARRLR